MRYAFALLCFLFACSLHAGKINPVILHNITGTKWNLVQEKKAGRIFSKADKNPLRQQVTFTTGSILFDSDAQNSQCDYTLKNKVEFWLYCTEPDQYIYKIKELTTSQLVMDMYVKIKSGKYVRKKRLVYARAT